MKSPPDNTFATWLQAQLDARKVTSHAAAARMFGVERTTVRNWLVSGILPYWSAVRPIADGLNVPVNRVLVAMGVLTDAEVGMVPSSETTLNEATTEQLLEAVQRRMK